MNNFQKGKRSFRDKKKDNFPPTFFRPLNELFMCYGPESEFIELQGEKSEINFTTMLELKQI